MIHRVGLGFDVHPFGGDGPLVLGGVRIDGPGLDRHSDADVVAHAVADALCTAGVRGILNFAPVVLKLPRRVRLVTVDLAIQLEQLAFQVQHGETADDE